MGSAAETLLLLLLDSEEILVQDTSAAIARARNTKSVEQLPVLACRPHYKAWHGNFAAIVAGGFAKAGCNIPAAPAGAAADGAGAAWKRQELPRRVLASLLAMGGSCRASCKVLQLVSITSC